MDLAWGQIWAEAKGTGFAYMHVSPNIRVICSSIYTSVFTYKTCGDVMTQKTPIRQ